MSRTVGMMVIEYVRLAKEEKEIHWENMRARMGRVPQPSPEGDQTESSSPTADPETAD